nr:zinc finger, CCHC-type [Tanacetum cinerariifolium]
MVAAMKHMASSFAKLEKFEGVDFRRWQKKMHFMLSSMSVVYRLTYSHARGRWSHVSLINPPSWKDFKHTLKHFKEELTLIELGTHLHIEESLRVQDSDKPKGNNVVGPSVVNMVEHNKSSSYNDNKGLLAKSSSTTTEEATRLSEAPARAVVVEGRMFMKYLEEQTDEEAKINSIKNGDQPLPCVNHVSIVGTSSTEQPPLKDKSIWSDQEKKIDRLARSLLIQGLSNDIYSLIDSNKTAKDLWDALTRHMLGSEYGEQDRKAAVLYSNKSAKDLWDALARHMLGSEYDVQERKAAVLYEYETFKATKGELLLDIYIRYLQVINDLKKCGNSKDNCELNFKFLNNLQSEWK